MPQISTNEEHQNPTALCRSQLNRAKFDFELMVTLRRQFLIPGHQITAPVKESTVTKIEPMPFASRPDFPDSKLSWRSTSHSTTRSVPDRGSPRSEPV